MTERTDRRTVLAGLAAALPAIALPAAAQRPATDPEPPCGLSPEHFPNVIVQAHDGRRARFWDDLVRDRTVLLHFFSIVDDAVYPVLANLARAYQNLQPLMGERLGRDVFLYSITMDPERDTSRALQDLAVRHGAGPGWLFLTGEPAAVGLLKARLFVHDVAHQHTGGPVEDCSRGLMRYGNAAAGLWGSVPAKADPQQIAARLSWVQARQPASGPPRRRGPVPLTEQPWWTKREERS